MFDEYDSERELQHEISDAEYDDILGREEIDLSDGIELDVDADNDKDEQKPSSNIKGKKPVTKKPIKKRPVLHSEHRLQEPDESTLKQHITEDEPTDMSDYSDVTETPVISISEQFEDKTAPNINANIYSHDEYLEVTDYSSFTNNQSRDFHNVMTSTEFFDSYQPSMSKPMMVMDTEGETFEIPSDKQSLADAVRMSAQNSVVNAGNNNEILFSGAVVIPPHGDTIEFNSYAINTGNSNSIVEDHIMQNRAGQINLSEKTPDSAETFHYQKTGYPDAVKTEQTVYQTSSGIEEHHIDGRKLSIDNIQNSISSNETEKNETHKLDEYKFVGSSDDKLPVGIEKLYKPAADHVSTDLEKAKETQKDNLTQKAIATDQIEKREMDSKAAFFFRKSINSEMAANLAVDAGMAVTKTITQNADKNDGIVVCTDTVQKIHYGIIGQTLAYIGARGDLQAYKNHCDEVAIAAEKIDQIYTDHKITADDFRCKESLRQKLEENDIHGKHLILKHRKELADVMESKEAFARLQTKIPGVYSDQEMKIISSNNFFSQKNCKAVQDITMKYFHNSANATLRAMEGNISVAHLKQMLKRSADIGLGSKEQAMIRQLIKLKKFDAAKKHLSNTKHGLKRAIVRSVERIDENVKAGIRAVRITIRTARTGLVIANAVYHTGKFLNKITGLAYLEHLVGRSIRKKTDAIKNVAKQKIKSSKPAKKIRETKHQAAIKIKNSPPVKTANKVNNAYKTKVEHLKNSKAGKAAKKTINGAKKAGKKVASAGKTAKSIVSKPLAAIGKLFSVVRKVKLIVLLAVALPILACVSMYLNVLFADMMLSAFINILATGSQHIIFVDDSEQLKGWAQEIQAIDLERYNTAVEVGEGPPINPEVLENHYIEHYGSPDKEKGYTIYYIDAYGNEIANKTTNAKDILCMATVMFQNDIAADEEAFYDLVMDLYDLMNPEVEYEESEIYTCLYGCDVFPYHCNCMEDYDLHDKYIADGCGEYEEMMPYSDEGCETDTEMADIESIDTSEWDEEDFYDDYGMPITEVPVEIHYCPGHETPICYGHKDLDIYITIYDKEYAYAENLYPEDWQSKSYAKYIKTWVEDGGWNDASREWCNNLFEVNWFDEYGFDIEGGAGFTAGEVLTNREIEEIEKTFSGDVSEARKAIVSYALEYVGRIPYYWGGKASSKNYDDNNFGSTVKKDYKGRTAKGLDCSGFVQWVYWCVLDDQLPGSTAGYAGKYTRIGHDSLQPGDLGFADIPGAKSNHIGIYAGQDENGNDYWVHCNSGAGNVSYNQTNCFHYYLRVMP